MRTATQKVTKATVLCLIALITSTVVFAYRQNISWAETTVSTPDVTDLEAQIRDKQAQISDLDQKQQQYQDAVTQKQQDALNLQNQISVLDNQIGVTDVSAQKLALQIDELTLQIKQLKNQIADKEAEIATQKTRLADVLRTLNRYNRKTYLEVTIMNDTFSKFFNQLKYLESLNNEAKRSLDSIQALKDEAEAKKQSQVEKKTAQVEKKHDLDIERANLASEQTYRSNLLDETKNSEAQFQNLLGQAKEEQTSANADIQTLEAQIRQRLQGNNELPQGPTTLIWPVPSHVVNTEFHDPHYPFRKIFEHPGLDIHATQGTPLRAAASGYVGRAQCSPRGLTAPCTNTGFPYSYIMLIHGNGLSTVYGHVSQISVAEGDFVVQGQVVGFSGGTPGSPGSGGLTTGAHLHFEVRLNGVPVNPRNYLPQ